MENKDLDNLFREAFDKAEETPNLMIWDKIEAQLDQESKIVPLTKKTTAWTKYAIAASILLAFGIGFQLLQKSPAPSADKLVEKTLTQIEENAENKAITESIPSNNKREEVIDKKEIATQSLIAKTTNPEKKVNIANYKITENTIPEEVERKTTNNIIAQIETAIPTVQVTDIDPIKPLIENPEETESMYAAASKTQQRSNVVTTVLNKLSENIEIIESKNLHFSADEEGSIRIDLINSFVKNRFKKRK